MNYYIASVSCGKDSLAMVQRLVNDGRQLDEVVFYDTGMEFRAIYNNWHKLCVWCDERGIKHTILRPEYDFEWQMFERKVKNRDGSGYHYGYDWCGGTCRWGTTDKNRALDNHAETLGAYVYVGIAADETQRLEKEKKPYKLHPLADWGMAEADCLQYCYAHGWDWLEEGRDLDGGPCKIDLYTILDRVSCWCCRNKNQKELRGMYRHLPHYWNELKRLQERAREPMKNYVIGRTVHEMEQHFALELKMEKQGLKINKRGQIVVAQPKLKRPAGEGGAKRRRPQHEQQRTTT